MKLYARLVVALGFPIAAACTLSLPLILLGAVAPDPRPWNWPTVYIVDFLSHGWRPISSDDRFAGCFPTRNAAIVLVFQLMPIF